MPVLAFAFALSLVTGMLFGTAPAWLASHADPAEALRGANRSTRDRASFSQKILVIVQATLSVVLLAGAGLLTRSLLNLQHQDFGYETDHRVTISLTAPFSSYSQPKLDAMYRELQDRLAHIPGVESAALAQYTPLQDNWGEIVIRQGHGMPNMNEDIRLFLGPCQPRLSRNPRRAHSPRPLHHRRRHRLHAERRRRQRSLRQEILQAGRGAAGRALRARSAPVTARPTKSSASYATPSTTTRKHRAAERPCSSCLSRSALHYDDTYDAESIDDSTHYIEGAVLKMHGSIGGLESAGAARPQRRRSESHSAEHPDHAGAGRLRTSTSSAPSPT